MSEDPEIYTPGIVRNFGAKEYWCILIFCNPSVNSLLFQESGTEFGLKFRGVNMLRSLCKTHAELLSGLVYCRQVIADCESKLSYRSLNPPGPAVYGEQFLLSSLKSTEADMAAIQYAMSLIQRLILDLSVYETRQILVRSNYRIHTLKNGRATVFFNAGRFRKKMEQLGLA